MTEAEAKEQVMSLFDATYEKHILQDELWTLQKTFEEQRTQITNRIKQYNEVIQIHTSSLDLDKILIAEKYLHVRGSYKQAGEGRESVINDAISWFTTGKVLWKDSGAVNPYKNLWTRYFGTKSYDRWHGQREDHEYGYGPRHGYMIFEVGLHREFRQGKDPQVPISHELNEEELNAILYYLMNLEKIQQAKADAKAALKE